MRLLGFTGNLMLAVFGLAMAAFYFFVMRSWAGEDGPGMPTMIGVGLFAALWLVGGIKRIHDGFKMVTPPPRSERAAAREAEDDEAGSFDPDAALARYVANRAAPEPSATTLAGPARGFGKRGL